MVILEKRVMGLSRLALARFVTRARRVAGLRGSVNVLVTSSAEMKSLNRQFRGKDQETDVLSFPAADSHELRAGRNGLPHRAKSGRAGDPGARPPQGQEFAGEIAISADIAARNARTLGHSPGVEVKILALHGILHLRGYDHDHDRGQMARRERKLRGELHLPAGLIERAEGSAAARGGRRGA